jgi:hypothetical protein
MPGTCAVFYIRAAAAMPRIRTIQRRSATRRTLHLDVCAHCPDGRPELVGPVALRRARPYREFSKSRASGPHGREIKPGDIELHHRNVGQFASGVETDLRPSAGYWMSLRCHTPRPHLMAESRAHAPWSAASGPKLDSLGEAVLSLGGIP